MTTELYSRQDLIGVRQPERVMVFGVGGIGSWVAIFSALSGASHLTLWDNDIVEESNRARIPFKRSDVGRPKTDALLDIILSFRPDLSVICLGKASEVLLNIIPTNDDLVYDCTDNSEAQNLIHKWCKARGLHYIKAGCNSTSITVTSTRSGWDTNPGQTGYTITPSWVVPAAVAAALAVYKGTYDQCFELFGEIDRITIKE